MPEEMIDIVDEAHTPLGTAPKALAHRLGLWHYAMQCWIYRVDPATGEVYLFFQKRSLYKDLNPDYFDVSAAGHYTAGERPADGVREISEELGLDVPFDSLLDLGIRTEVIKTGELLNREFCRVYLLRTDLEPSDITPDGDEVHGLVEIAAVDGLALFSGEQSAAPAGGIELRSGAWEPFAGALTSDRFVPRVDRYYLKMFMLARLAARGERYLTV